MRFGSLFSGIEAASEAWLPLGWEPQFYSEIDPFPCAVLAHRHPQVPNYGDVTAFKRWPRHPDLDVLVGGSPCQSFSIAGLRKGLDDPRGNLMLTYLGVVKRERPTWVVWENVPGVLSSDKGKAFGTFLGVLGQLGYGFAYRVLDAQYFGVAQRRRRVFVVASARGWRAAAAVLFERQSLRGDPAPRRQAGKAAPTIPSRRSAGGGLGTDFDLDGGTVATTLSAGSHAPGSNAPGRRREDDDNLVVNALTERPDRGGTNSEGQRLVAHTLLAKDNMAHDETTDNLIAHSLRAEGFDASEDGTGRGVPLVAPTLDAHMDRKWGSNQWVDQGFAVLSSGQASDLSQPITTRHGDPGMVAFAQNQREEVRELEVAGALAAEPGMKQQTYLRLPSSVRRLTPRECERLQGFPDDHTLIPYGKRGRPSKDGPRYKALGNSMAVPVMRWIGERIALVEALNL